MLKVSIHAGPAINADRFNLIAWLDIGYQKLNPIADYKIVLYQAGFGATSPIPLLNYPRWSKSLWDLIARSISLGLSSENPLEAVPIIKLKSNGYAFASEICVLIEHFPGGDNQKRSTLGTAHIYQVKRNRGTYQAKFDEQFMPTRTTEPFEFKVEYLRPAELLLYACLIHLTDRVEMPARPGLCLPTPIELNQQRYVPVHRLVQPARSGFLTWLASIGATPLEYESAPLGIVSENLYIKFLHEAI